MEHYNSCSICSETQICNIIRIKLGCTHIFHKNCIKTYCETHIQCPLCMSYISNEDMIHIKRENILQQLISNIVLIQTYIIGLMYYIILPIEKCLENKYSTKNPIDIIHNCVTHSIKMIHNIQSQLIYFMYFIFDSVVNTICIVCPAYLCSYIFYFVNTLQLIEYGINIGYTHVYNVIIHNNFTNITDNNKTSNNLVSDTSILISINYIIITLMIGFLILSMFLVGIIITNVQYNTINKIIIYILESFIVCRSVSMFIRAVISNVIVSNLHNISNNSTKSETDKLDIITLVYIILIFLECITSVILWNILYSFSISIFIS